MFSKLAPGALAAVALFPALARAAPPPPPLRDPEPAPLTRAPEHLRRPVELVPKLSVSEPLCGRDDTAGLCALGAVAGVELAALYRPTAYFAFGGAAFYGRGLGGAGGAGGDTLGLALAGRVYLLEESSLDPYLEALAGVSSERSVRERAGRHEVASASGSYGRVGGGLDWFASPALELGVFAGYAELLPAGRGAVTAGFGASLLFGEGL
jgi:hypothetical protein